MIGGCDYAYHGFDLPGKIKEDTGREISPLLIFLDSKGEHSFKPKEEHSYGEIPDPLSGPQLSGNNCS